MLSYSTTHPPLNQNRCQLGSQLEKNINLQLGYSGGVVINALVFIHIREYAATS